MKTAVEHVELPLGPVNFDLVSGVTVTCKIDCQNRFTPCIFEFTYRAHGDLKAYASLLNEAPDSENCDVSAVGRPAFLKITNDNAHCFTQRFIYLTLVSTHNCEVTVNTCFNLVDPRIKINEAIEFGREKRKTRYDLVDLQRKMII